MLAHLSVYTLTQGLGSVCVCSLELPLLLSLCLCVSVFSSVQEKSTAVSTVYLSSLVESLHRDENLRKVSLYAE